MHAGVIVLCGLLLSQAGASTAPTTSTGRIAGRVIADGSNAPIAGARIMLFPARPASGPIARGGMWRPLQTQTADDGRFVFDKVEPGTYRLDVQKTGFAPLGEPERAPTAAVYAGRTTDVALTLQKGAVIAGKLLDAQGEPLPDVRMIAMRHLTRPAGMPQRPASAMFLVPAPGNGQQQTNDLGEFRISGLAPGEYYVAAMPGGGMMVGAPATTTPATGKANTTTYYPGTNDQAAAQPIKVAAGETVYNIVFSVQSVPGFRISGRVVDENGAAVSGAMVMLMPDRPNGFMGPPGHASTGDDGRFTFADVPSATYRINASIPIMVGNGRGGAVTDSGGIGADSGGIVVSRSGGSFTSWTSLSGRGASGGDQPAQVVVNGADVSGIRVVVRRPQQ
jgi:carboxypeptidase family protein